jgi:hypothetical protein
LHDCSLGARLAVERPSSRLYSQSTFGPVDPASAVPLPLRRYMVYTAVTEDTELAEELRPRSAYSYYVLTNKDVAGCNRTSEERKIYEHRYFGCVTRRDGIGTVPLRS